MTIAIVRDLTSEDGDGVIGWIVETWARHSSPKQRPRTRPVIRHLLRRPGVRVLLAVPSAAPMPDPDIKPFGWACVEPWDDGTTTVHYVYVRDRVPSRVACGPASPVLRGLGIGKQLVSELGGVIFYTTSARRRYVPAGWRFDPWR